jgi:transcriptional regulator with XRE-family HTH domain
MSTKKATSKAMVNNLQTLLDRIKGSETYDKEVARDQISEQIHLAMKRERVSNAELAKRLGKSRAYVTKILQGNANFTTDTLVQIAGALGYRYMPILMPKIIWSSIKAIHLSAKLAKPASNLSLDAESYVPVLLTEGGENAAGKTRIAG